MIYRAHLENVKPLVEQGSVVIGGEFLTLAYD